MVRLKKALAGWNRQPGRIPVVFDGCGEMKVIGDVAPADFLYPESAHNATHAVLAERGLPARQIERGFIGDQFYIVARERPAKAEDWS